MCRRPHYLLFAAGPIGLITTVVTLIHLSGSTTVRRLIGRQFETKAEVLADVTSVSYGAVSLEFKGDNLEQTTNPSISHVAQFYIRGVSAGTGMDMLYARSQIWRELLGSVGEPQAYAICSLTTGTDDYERIERIRIFATITFLGYEYGSKRIPEIEAMGEGCTGISAISVTCSGVSLGLTASHCLDSGLQDNLRIFVAAFCMLGAWLS
ncbi:hypothetical protein K440DRAFT_630438 [Wilcoxina mikolae CBS 423.85]|nr:hypothetical protein K440DRAFT_630438 [Wilcoxina mikolae CBS 423.85]